MPTPERVKLLSSPAQAPNKAPAASLPDRSVTKVTLFAGAVIVFSILLVGWLVYTFTEREAVDKLQSKDLVHLADSIAAKVDGQIRQAKETSLLMAEDPVVIDWVAGGEKDDALGAAVKRKLSLLTEAHGYDNSFLVSNVTKQYWGEKGAVLRVMSLHDAEDAWFYTYMADRRPIEVVLDYAVTRGDTFVFVNAMIGGTERALGVTGVGLSLKQAAAQFRSYKYGESSHLWLIDRAGVVYLSDRYEQAGEQIRNLLPKQASDELFAAFGETKVTKYKDASAGLTDLISFPIASADLHIVFAIPRSETLPFLRTIKIDTIAAVLASLLAIVGFFFYVSRKLADPFKRALRHNEELERKVAERTRELSLKHEQMTDSIAYAKRIQESVLFSDDVLEVAFAGHYAIRKPRDLVGGDFYWAKHVPGGTLIAVADCTGHGVPGAFMTLLAQSLLGTIAEHECADDPARILAILNRRMKATLRQEARNGQTDDGLDIGLLYVTDQRVVFAGARCPLFAVRPGAAEPVEVLPGNRKSVGYRRTPADYAFDNVELRLEQGMTLYMATDGLFDQNGGERDVSFGKKRFLGILAAHAGAGVERGMRAMSDELDRYMANREQRDDITVLALSPMRPMGAA